MRSTLRTASSGFSLLESLFALFLVFVVLGAVVTTLRAAVSVRQGSADASLSTEVAHAASLLRQDSHAASSLSLVSPTDVRMTMIDPRRSLEERVSGGGAFGADEQVVVRYFFENKTLYRHLLDETEPEERVGLMELEDFRCTLDGEVLFAEFRVKTQRLAKTYRFACGRTVR